jgi:hypothetical protein
MLEQQASLSLFNYWSRIIEEEFETNLIFKGVCDEVF